MANIKVAVRVRPISARELNLTGSQVVVRAARNEICLTNLKVSSSKAGDSRERTRRYGFDYCFDSSNAEAESYADQATIYGTLGQPVLDGVFSGYNSCLVAYGQTASGKTYTMMGTKEDPGLTPRLCEGLFARLEEEKRNERMYCVSVSYLEIYNERVRDLLKPAGGPGGLRVREHPRLGPYVQGLTRHVVHTLGSLMSYVEEGSKARKTASTLQNPSSSRSHALLTIALSEESVNVAATSGAGQISAGPAASSGARRNLPAPRSASELHLVDLAGSESAATCSGVHRLKEGANINKSLVALGNVISALAERGSTGSGPGRRFIPYRDSSLTWLLKDALGGNATTIMLATISPASGSYNETAHTLRFAQRAQSVVNRPVINEDPVAKIIRELRAEVARLKSLLLEKDAVVDGRRTACNCGTQRSEPETDSSGIKAVEYEVGSKEEDKEEDDHSVVRRSNSIEGIVKRETQGQVEHLRRFGSYECLSATGRLSVNYRRARVTELKDEEDEINESVFVDIPTLVAVLIKPDDSLQEPGTQIEEICSDELVEDSIGSEFIDSANDHEAFNVEERLGATEQEDQSSPLSPCQAVDFDLQDVYRDSLESVSRLTEVAPQATSKLRKQDSIEILARSSNLHTSRKFGSVETIQRRKEPLVGLERSQTNLEKRPVLSERGKKLNNIREIEDQKGRSKAGSFWRGSSITGSKEHLQRKGSNDSDKSQKDSPSAKSKGHARKPSLESLKRKTSKDSSSSSSKDEQILIPASARDKLLRRKSSIDQEGSGSGSPGRAHTPIQRTKRAEIVAAVTERLYASRKHVEEGAASTSASGVRSPPEGTDVKVTPTVSSTRSKLQEISRRMLAKRRRVCVDTQTDILHTVRVKDTASLTELHHQDVAVLTDNHETCDFSEYRIPTLRVKEMATLTDKPKTTIVRCRDVGSLATDFQDFECDLQSLRHDSGILSDDTQNYAESNLSSTEVSDLCVETDRRILCRDSSTNTYFLSPCRNSAVQVPQLDVPRVEVTGSEAPICIRDCCKSVQEPRQMLQSSSAQTAPLETLVPQVPSGQMANLQVAGVQVPSIQLAGPEKNVISISLPDMISITIESSNILESRVAVMDSVDHVEEKLKIITRDRESQTETHSDASIDLGNRLCFKDLTRSSLSQTEGRVFRIENIFQDPKNVTRNCSRLDETSGILDDGPAKNSFTLTNSLGTSYVTNSKDGELEGAEEGKLYSELSKTSSFPRDGLITEAFITKKLSLAHHGCCGQFIHGPWENWSIYRPVQCVDYRKPGDALPASWQLENHQTLINDLTLARKSHLVPSTVEDNSSLTNDDPLNAGSSSTILEANTLDHEYNFSDDSLDYNVNTILKLEPTTCEKDEGDSDSRENLCPPDVVAHTKKELHKAINSSEADKENAENVESNTSSDFEVEDYVEIPKARPNDLPDGQAVHDYKTLIFGEPFTNLRETTVEGLEGASSGQKGGGKKRVSFSNSNTPEKGREADKRAAGRITARPAALKSIIKKKKVSPKELEETQYSKGQADDFLQPTSSSTQENINNDSNKVPEIRGSTAGQGQDSDECLWNLREPRKRMRLPEEDISEDTCSESDSCSSLEDEEELFASSGRPRSVVEEYLSEAAKFMRNMNSINEYMSATRSFGRCPAGSRCRRSRRRASSTWDDDYREYRSRKISSQVDTDEHLREEDIAGSTDSYDKCLEGIRRLENCIQKVDRQTEFLREKYGINCESAGARLSLASPGIDPNAFAAGKREPASPNTGETTLRTLSSVSRELPVQVHPGNNNSEFKEDQPEEENLEKRIFDQLMSAVDSGRSWSLRRSRPSRWSPTRTSDNASRTSHSAYRENVDLLGPGSNYDNNACDDSFGIGRGAFSPENYVSTCTNYDSLHNDSAKAKPEDSLAVKSQEILNELGITDDWLDRDPSRSTLESSQEGRSRHSSKASSLLKVDTSDIENQGSPEPMEGSLHLREKLRYPGSPRARFLELLRERRRIVENSRGSSLS